MSNVELVSMLAKERSMKAMGFLLDQFDFDNCQEAKPGLYTLQYVADNGYTRMLTIENRLKMYYLLDQLGGDYETMWSPDWEKYCVMQRRAIIKAGGATDWFTYDYIDKAIELIAVCLTNAKYAYMGTKRFDAVSFVKRCNCALSGAYNACANGTLEGELAKACVYVCNLAGYRNTIIGRSAWGELNGKDIEQMFDKAISIARDRGVFLFDMLNCVLYACDVISRRVNFDLELFVELHIKYNGPLLPNLEIRQWEGKRHKNKMRRG